MKKKFLVTLIIFLTIVVISLVSSLFFDSQSSQIQEKTILKSAKTVQPTVTPIVKSKPLSLSIKDLNINADVESVGMDSAGRMDVPKNANNVAWYNLGFYPGQKGSAVIAGHFDRQNGSPAVFYNLEKLEKGDEITIALENGDKITYFVTRKELYQHDEVPLEEIFNSKDRARLNLITCDGVFDEASKNYSDRLVVYSEISQ